MADQTAGINNRLFLWTHYSGRIIVYYHRLYTHLLTDSASLIRSGMHELSVREQRITPAG